MGAGTAAELRAPGIVVTVAAGTTQAFSAVATDAAGNASACSPGAFAYENRPATAAPRAGKLMRVARSRLRGRRVKTGFVVRCPAASSKPCAGTVHLYARVARHAGSRAKRRLVGSTTVRARPGPAPACASTSPPPAGAS